MRLSLMLTRRAIFCIHIFIKICVEHFEIFIKVFEKLLGKDSVRANAALHMFTHMILSPKFEASVENEGEWGGEGVRGWKREKRGKGGGRGRIRACQLITI